MSLPRAVLGETLRWAVLVTLVWFLGICVSRTAYPFDVGHYEAYMWAPAQLVLSGQNPYDARHVFNPPFTLAAYGPLYYLMIALGIGAFDLQLWFGRLLSVLSAGVGVACIGYMSRRLTGSADAAWLGILAALSQYPLQHWVAMQRSDLPGLGFSFAGMAVAVWAVGKRRWPAHAVLSGLLLAAGFFCKQVFILPTLATIGLCAALGALRLGLLAAVSGATIGLGVAGFLDVTSSGGYLWQHLMLPQGLDRSWGKAAQVLRSFVTAPSTILTASALALPAFRRFRRADTAAGNRVDVVLWCYSAATVALALVLSRFRGSNLNYYLEASLALPLAAAVASARLSTSIRSKIAVALAIGAAVFLFRFSRGEYYRWMGLPYYRALVTAVQKSVAPSEPIVTVYPELAVAARRRYHFNDVLQYQDGRSVALVTVLAEGVRSRRYAAVINHDSTPPAGYRLADIPLPLPEKYWRTYLHVRMAE